MILLTNYEVIKEFDICNVKGEDVITYKIGELLECVQFNIRYATFRDSKGIELTIYSMQVHKYMRKIDDTVEVVIDGE